MHNLGQSTDNYFLTFDHASWSELRSILGATSIDSDEKVRDELNSLLKKKITGAEKNKTVYLVAGDTVLECGGPVAHPGGQGTVICVIHCFKLSHDIFDLMSAYGQQLPMRWEIIIPGYDHQNLLDNTGNQEISDVLQFELPKSDYTAFLNNMNDMAGSKTLAGNQNVGSFFSGATVPQVVPAHSPDCFAQLVGKEITEQQVAILKNKYLPLNWNSAPLPEIAAALIKWSFSLKDERKKFVACVMSGPIVGTLKDCLSQMDPPAYYGGEKELYDLSQQLVQVWQQLSFRQEVLDSLEKEIKTLEQHLVLLDQYGKLKGEENALIKDLGRLKAMPVPAIQFNPALFLDNRKVYKALSKTIKIESELLKDPSKSRPSKAQRKYEKSLSRLSDLLNRYSGKYGGLVADQEKVVVQFQLSRIQSELESLLGLLAKLTLNADSPEARADLAKSLRKAIAADRFSIALLQGINKTKNAPVPAIALEFLDKPSLFLLDSQNTESCELLAALSPKLVLIDEMVDPNLWLQSSQLVLKWSNNTLTPLGGSTIPEIENTLEQLRVFAKSNTIDIEALCRAFPGITPAMFGYFIQNLSQ